MNNIWRTTLWKKRTDIDFEKSTIWTRIMYRQTIG